MEDKKDADYRNMLQAIDEIESRAREKLFEMENSVSLSISDVVRKKQESIEFLLGFYRMQGGSGYTQLAQDLEKFGIKVSDGVLKTTIGRARKSRGKRSKRVGEVSSAAPLVVTKPVVMTKPLAVSTPVVAPAPVSPIDWKGEKDRLAGERAIKGDGWVWTDSDAAILEFFVTEGKRHKITLSSSEWNNILPKHIQAVQEEILIKARALKKMPI